MTEATDTPKRILVVEDDDDLRGLVARIFADSGHDVTLASDGGEAIELLYARRPDLVVLDLMLPGLTGWDVLRHVRKLAAPPPVVLVSVRTDFETYQRAVEQGVAAYVEKPFSVREFVQTCCTILREGPASTAPARDRRVSPRRLFRIPARVHLKETAWYTTGELVDLSSSGARVALAIPLPHRDGVHIAVQVPGIGELLKVEGRVQWRVPVDRGFAYGLAFVNLGSETEEQLRAILRPAS